MMLMTGLGWFWDGRELGHSGIENLMQVGRGLLQDLGDSAGSCYLPDKCVLQDGVGQENRSCCVCLGVRGTKML